MPRGQTHLVISPKHKAHLSKSGFQDGMGHHSLWSCAKYFGPLPKEGTWGAHVRSPMSQAEMLSLLFMDSSSEDFYQGTFSFTFLGRWLSFAALEACCVMLSQAPNHSHHPSPKMLVSGVHPHTHCFRIKSWSLAEKLPAPCPAPLHAHSGLREGPEQIKLS